MLGKVRVEEVDWLEIYIVGTGTDLEEVRVQAGGDGLLVRNSSHRILGKKGAHNCF